jgi:hypothetical protein
MLTDTVQPGAGSMLPNARRARLAQLQQQAAELEGAEPDITQMQQYAKQRSAGGDVAMLNALAAQFAGDSFQPVQAQYLKRAAAARDPMKLGGGTLTADGQFLRDPFASQERQIGRLDRLITSEQAGIEAADRAELIRRDRIERDELIRGDRLERDALIRGDRVEREEQARQERLRREAEDRRRDQRDHELRVEGQNLRRLMLTGGSLGSGTATQIGSGPNNEPLFRMRDGRLFTYDQNGQPAPYTGQVLPKAGNAAPTEDERKAAGWFFQADNARRNMEQIVRRNPAASRPTVTERGLTLIPVVGEDVANTFRPEDRQKFIQASSSMAEALLRAATGAGVNRDESEQKVRELVPQLGEKPGTTQQKLAAYDVYMKSLQARAGRALPQNAPGAAPAGNEDPLGLRGGR